MASLGIQVDTGHRVDELLGPRVRMRLNLCSTRFCPNSNSLIGLTCQNHENVNKARRIPPFGAGLPHYVLRSVMAALATVNASITPNSPER